MESNSTYQPPSNNPAASTASTENPPEDFREEENFDLIKRYWTDPEAASSPQDYNPDPLEAVGRVSKKIVQCINLVQTTLKQSGVPYVKSSTAAKTPYPQSEDVTAHLDRVDKSLLECINLAQTTLGENSVSIA